jgi:hypothetical protein
VCVIAPAAAEGAMSRVQVEPGGKYCDIKGCSTVPARYRMVGSADSDRVTLSPAGPMAVTVQDPGGVSGCGPSSTRVVCYLRDVDAFDLGAGADTISLAALARPLPVYRGRRMPVRGGAGDDTVIGSAFSDVLDGADGTDRIHGGAGRDRLIGGVGDDTLIGGAGFDTASYSERATVDLARVTPNGPLGQSDRLIGIEGAVAARGSQLAGGDGPNVLIAPGRGLVSGRGGPDFLVGGRLDGGSGSDYLAAVGVVDGLTVGGDVRPVVNCGAGNDVVDAAEAAPARITPDCERIKHEDYGMRIRLRRRSARGVVLRVSGLFCGDTKPCRAKLVLRGRRRVLGSARVRYLHRRGRLALRLSRRGRRAFKRRRSTRVRIELTVRGSDGFRLRVASKLQRR